MKKNTITWIVAIFAMLFLLFMLFGEYLIHDVLPYSAISPYRLSTEETRIFAADSVALAERGCRFENFTVLTSDSVLLAGIIIYPPTEARGVAVLLHGIASCKEGLFAKAGLFLRDSLITVVFDQRAHGQSGGKYCTFGAKEKSDVSALVSVIASKTGKLPFLLYGHSLGGAVTLQTVATDSRFTCAIAESPFANLRETIHDYFRQQFHVPVDWIPDESLRRAEEIAAFRVDSVSPEQSARRITIPTLIIHGENDEKIGIHYGKRIVNALACEQKEWYFVPGADHNHVATFGGAEYSRRIRNFIETHLKEK